MTRRPNLFIVGAPKSGTTSLHQYLAGHPDVYMSPVKEPFFFSPDINRRSRRPYRHGEPAGEAAYLGLFAAAHDERHVGEASTRYLWSPGAPALIHAFEPAARIVANFRDPVEVMHSMHIERVNRLEEDITDFEQALAADDDRRAGRRLPPGGTPLGSTYRDMASFGTNWQRWLDQFGPPQTHAIVFDDLVADPAATFRRLLEFLEVDAQYRPESFEQHNRTYRRRTGPLGALLFSPPLRWLASVPLPALIGGRASQRLSQIARRSRLFRLPGHRPPIEPALRDRLRTEMAGEVDLLSRLVGRDLAGLWWGDQPAVGPPSARTAP